jgi:hypothetical protein
LIDIIKPLVKGVPKEPNDKRRQIFEEHVHVAMDNFFSGDKVLRFLGEGGWKATMTCRRDWLPKEVPKMYFNFLITMPVNTRSKLQDLSNPSLLLKTSSSLGRKLQMMMMMFQGQTHQQRKTMSW